MISVQWSLILETLEDGVKGYVIGNFFPLFYLNIAPNDNTYITIYNTYITILQ